MTVTRNIWHQKVALLINLPLGVIRLLHPRIRWTKASPSLNPTERGKNIEVLISDTASSYMWLIQRWSFSCLGWNKYEICHTYFVVLLWNRFCFLCPKSFPFAVVFSLHTAHGHILITSLTVECWNTFFSSSSSGIFIKLKWIISASTGHVCLDCREERVGVFSAFHRLLWVCSP